jgi:hypothetical protein
MFAAIALAATLMTPKIQAQVLNEISPEAMQQIQALEAEKASRTTAQKKIDSNLLYSLKANLPPGLYTAILAGANNGTGVGTVEVYDRGP